MFHDDLKDAVQADPSFRFHKLAIELAAGKISVDDKLDFIDGSFSFGEGGRPEDQLGVSIKMVNELLDSGKV
jgi:hypothetical protein